MTLLTELAAVLANSNNALAGVFLLTHAKEIINLVEAVERHCVKRMLDDDYELRQALAALNKEKNT
jgi:uncharacterized protein with von Willebrand factor type A (vWA) domain